MKIPVMGKLLSAIGKTGGSGTMIGIFIALISGALMSVQGVFNTEVTKASSVWVSASWVQLSALVTCLAVWSVK